MRRVPAGPGILGYFAHGAISQARGLQRAREPRKGRRFCHFFTGRNPPPANAFAVSLAGRLFFPRKGARAFWGPAVPPQCPWDTGARAALGIPPGLMTPKGSLRIAHSHAKTGLGFFLPVLTTGLRGKGCRAGGETVREGGAVLGRVPGDGSGVQGSSGEGPRRTRGQGGPRAAPVAAGQGPGACHAGGRSGAGILLFH